MIKENQKEEFKAVFLDNFKAYFNSPNFNLYQKGDELTIESLNHIKKIVLNANSLNIRIYDNELKDVINKMFEASALEIGLKSKQEEQPKKRLKL